MKTRLAWVLSVLLAGFLSGPVGATDEVRNDEKGTFLGALFGKGPRGAVITHVLPDSPAARASLCRHDVVLEYDRRTVRDANHLARLIRTDKPDRKVRLLVLRGTRRHSVDITLALGPALKLAETLPPPATEPAEPKRGKAVSVRATPLNSGKVKWTIEYSAPSGKKVVTCEGAAAELSRTLQKLPERERQLVRIALERLRALDRPRGSSGGVKR